MRTGIVSGVWFIMLLCIAGCAEENKEGDQKGADSSTSVPQEPDTTTVMPSLSELYENADYQVSLDYPEKWILLEESGVPGGSLAINLFPPDRGGEADVPLDLHGKAGLSYIAIWPGGLGTELPSGRSALFADAPDNVPETGLKVNRNQSRIFYLEDGTPWGYYIVPASPPANWSRNGFIFAQYRIDNFKARCYDDETGKEKPVRECDPLEGDRFTREGKVNPNEGATINAILTSLSIGNVKKQRPLSDLIRLEHPLPNLDVTSPLKIKGKARGEWYFEASFPVSLYDARDSLLAEGGATAQENWMTEEFVPFTAELTFNAPDDERGKLVLHRSNMSGLPENDRSLSIPVIFPPR